MLPPKTISITGAAGQIGYALLPRIASGELFGKEQPLHLKLLEVEAALPSLEGVAMELEDGDFPAIASVQTTSDLKKGFTDTEWALLIGGTPRKAGMERKDLLAINGSIFVDQGKALASYAASNLRVLVVGNPANTNCLIARSHAPEIPRQRWFAMTRLDENRAKAVLAKKLGISVTRITKMAIWGNHSNTLYADVEHACVDGKPLHHFLTDKTWLQNEFLPTVQKRGAIVIAARGKSSALSAADAILHTVKSLEEPTPSEEWHSVALPSEGDYGVDRDLLFSFPTIFDGKELKIVENLTFSNYAQTQIEKTLQELREERAAVSHLLPSSSK